MCSLILLVSILGLLGSIQAEEKGLSMIEIGTLSQCEGKDASNYTYINTYVMESSCTGGVLYESHGLWHLISCSASGQKAVIAVEWLADFRIELGGQYQYEVLFLALSGPLEGRYLYFKEIGDKESYLKKCSSVLGYSYTSTKSMVLLIIDKLDLNIFLSPTGAFESFKKTASTICQGGTTTF